MKCIINGRAYNTETADHIATGRALYERHGRERAMPYNLYRTKGGAFFLVIGDAETNKRDVDFFPMHKDSARAFMSGERFTEKAPTIHSADADENITPLETTVLMDEYVGIST